jgi:pimeloyl-ACP methyl ester carboxylesterase
VVRIEHAAARPTRGPLGSGEVIVTTPQIGSSGDYVDINGVKTWHESFGSGPPLVLLHGGLSSSLEWEFYAPALAEHFTVHLYDRRAHGRSSDPGPYSYALMADDALAFLEQAVKGPASLVGWSDGANVALAVAARRPDLVTKLVTIGANIRPDGVPQEVNEGFAATTPDDPMLDGLRQMHVALSPDGEAHWPVLLAKEVSMATAEAALDAADLSRITAPTLVIAGDDDMPTIEHSAEIFRGISNAQLAIVPGASHGVPMEKPELIQTLIRDFLLNDPAPTMMPIRRGGGAPPA